MCSRYGLHRTKRKVTRVYVALSRSERTTLCAIRLDSLEHRIPIHSNEPAHRPGAGSEFVDLDA